MEEARKEEFVDPMGTKLYVGNLSYSTTEQTLRAAFEEGGREVREVAMISDRETGRPKGFAFVQMGSEDDAKAAIANFSDPGPVSPFVPAGKPPATPVPN